MESQVDLMFMEGKAYYTLIKLVIQQGKPLGVSSLGKHRQTPKQGYLL